MSHIFTFSTYAVGTNDMPTGLSLTTRELKDLLDRQPAERPIPSYMIDWALMPHAVGDFLFAIHCETQGEHVAVVRHEIIVR